MVWAHSSNRKNISRIPQRDGVSHASRGLSAVRGGVQGMADGINKWRQHRMLAKSQKARNTIMSWRMLGEKGEAPLFDCAESRDSEFKLGS